MPRFFSTQEQRKFLSKEAYSDVKAGKLSSHQYFYDRLKTGEPSSTTLSSSTDSATPTDATSPPSSIEINSTPKTASRHSKKMIAENTQAIQNFAAETDNDAERDSNKNSSASKKKSSGLWRCLFCCFGINTDVEEPKQKELAQNLLVKNSINR
ncbi:MAG: hypothetical protein ACD_45C00348G0007 [uncultured bacterium]|nr:MAG: hypothetical protein ACD_45C00348G0007 [uncultured bacterium]